MFIESTFEKRCLDTEASAELSFTSATVSIILILTNIPGNILIILALVLDPNKNLRTPFNWLVVNLATADLIVGIIALPMSVYYHITEGLNKHNFTEGLPLLHMAYFTSCTASVLSLTSLAVERYLAVRKPNTYRTKVTDKRVVLTIIMIWLISLSLPCIYLYVGFTTYAFIFANTSIVVAVAIMCVTYTLMRRQLNKIRLRNDRNSNVSSIPSTATVIRNTHSIDATPQTAQSASTEVIIMDQFSNTNSNPNTSNAVATRRQLLEAKVTEMFLIVLIALLCCYGTSTIVMYLVNFCDSCNCATLHWFRDIHVQFIVLNSSINFFCYALRSARFQNAFAKLVRINRC